MIEEILPRVNQIQEANQGFKLIKYSLQLSNAQTDSSTRIPVRDQWGFCDDQCSIERSDMSTIKHRKNENVIWLIFLNSYTFKIVETLQKSIMSDKP